MSTVVTTTFKNKVDTRVSEQNVCGLTFQSQTGWTKGPIEVSQERFVNPRFSGSTSIVSSSSMEFLKIRFECGLSL